MNRISNGWRLLKESWSVLMQNKRMLIYPIVAGIAGLIVLVIAAAGSAPFVGDGNSDELTNRQYAALAAIWIPSYLVLTFIINFCNAALIGSTLKGLEGGRPTVSEGFAFARERLGPIAGYSVIAATVGLLLSILRERGGVAGVIISALGGAAWGLITYLVVPVLVAEKVSPIDGIKRSGSLLKRTWGEQITGNIGVGLILFLIGFGAAIIGGGITLGLWNAGLAPIAVITAILTIFGLLAIATVGTALKGIFSAALYRFATNGETGSAFDSDLLTEAFVRK
jgi:hypothetical protein